MKKIYLCLSDGTVFEGKSFGSESMSVGEVVFNTSMVGYPEILTDNNYKGQIVIQTFPLIGNYGMVFDGENTSPSISGLVVREVCETPSNFRNQGTLSEYLKSNNIPAICGVDTRELTRILREKGCMNGAICEKIPENFDFIKKHTVLNLVQSVSAKKTKIYGEGGKHKVALIDLGTSADIISTLVEKNCEINVFPWNVSKFEIDSYCPNGVVISDGPGDPRILEATSECVKELCGKYPIFAIGLGHQVLAISNECKIKKMKVGHRGANQPSINTQTKRTHITVQNHGYSVELNSIPSDTQITFVNANDGSCEGLLYPKINAFSVQFRPEASCAPNNTLFLFEKFIKNMEV